MIQNYLNLVRGGGDRFEGIAKIMEEPISNDVRSKLIRTYSDLVETGAFDEFIKSVLSTIEEDQFFSPIWISSTEAPLIATDSAVLSLRYYHPSCDQSSIYGVPSDIYLSLLNATASVDVRVYDINSHTYEIVGEQVVRLSKRETIHIEKWQTFKIEASGTVCLSRLLLGLSEGIPVYDARTLQYISMLSLNPISSRWYFMAKVAGLLGKEAATSILLKLTQHPNYHVRWSALQELFNQNQIKAFSMLDKFRSDENPYINRKAESEWKRISGLLTG